MTGLRPRRPSAAMIVALVALFVALGGTSYAAITLGKNSVGTKQLKKNAVTTAKIKNGAVTAGKVAANTFVPTGKVMSAIVTNNGSVNVTGGTPGVTATLEATGYVFVRFPRPVIGCAWNATQGNGTNTFVPADFATVRNNGDSNVVGVVTYNTSANQVNANFQVLVVCP